MNPRPPRPEATAAASGEAQLSLEPLIAPESVAPPVPAPRRVLRVSELVRAARMTLEARFADITVEGEVSGLKRSGNGHLYFCLKESEAQLDCVMFSREAGRVRFRLEDGLLVRCRGRLTIYQDRGKFQLSVVAIEPAGAGALALAFAELKQRLAAEGLFEPSRKRPLPFLPRRIGVVTSLQGAVIRDIARIAHRRCPVPILVAPAPVQGDGAALAIGGALRQIGAVADVDVVIVARGGGSIEDLWAFNEETVARAIAACPVPVISAVGHETDFTIADFVADARASTPSAAAEMATPVAADLVAELGTLAHRLRRGLEADVRARRLCLERTRAALGDPRRMVDQRRQAIHELAARNLRTVASCLARTRAGLRAAELRLLRAHPQRRIADQRQALASLERALRDAAILATGRRRRALDAASVKLEALSPLRVLERGYGIARRLDGGVVSRATEVAPGDRIEVLLHDGEIQAVVEASRPGRRPEER